MSHPALDWGVLGTALIAREHVIPALLGADLVNLVAVASRSEDRASEMANAFSIPRAYGSYEELLADESISVVYIPLPNHLHAPWIERAINAGKHVLCEKPLTLTAAETDVIAARAAAGGVIVMEAFMYRFHPAWDQVRRLLTEGRIGRVTDVAVWFSFRSTRPTDYRHSSGTGGGALYDVGCYAVDVIRTFLGNEPERVMGTGRLDPITGVDLTFTGILDYATGVGSFTCSMEQEPQHSVMIHGTQGWISIDDPFNCPTDHITTIHVGTGGNHHPHASTVESIEVAPADQYGLEATALSAAILNGEPSPYPIEDSVANARILDRLFAVAGINTT